MYIEQVACESFSRSSSFMFFSRHLILYTENRYKHEAMINGEPVIFEILDTCPKVSYVEGIYSDHLIAKLIISSLSVLISMFDKVVPIWVDWPCPFNNVGFLDIFLANSCDGGPKSDKDLLAVDSIQWADGFLFVYSILDKASFDYIQQFRRHVLEIKNIGVNNSKDQPANPIPSVLLANKADMVHLRQVATHEGNLFILLGAFSCSFRSLTSQ